MAVLRTCVVAALAVLAAASPLMPRQSVGYRLTAVAKHPIRHTAVNASHTAFSVDVATDAVCISGVPCSSFPNFTAIGVGYGGASMYVEVPGGQEVYVAPSGALSFTEPHAEGLYPAGSATSGFSLETVGSETYFVFSGNGSTGWAICGTGGQVFALIDGVHCVEKNPIKLLTTAVSERAAWQYDD